MLRRELWNSWKRRFIKLSLVNRNYLGKAFVTAGVKPGQNRLELEFPLQFPTEVYYILNMGWLVGDLGHTSMGAQCFLWLGAGAFAPARVPQLFELAVVKSPSHSLSAGASSDCLSGLLMLSLCLDDLGRQED